jgi:Protein of unknown function (DUF692)
MNAISRRGNVGPDRRLRFPALPVADSAGTSFKHEHLNAILAESPQAGFFEVHAENHMGAGGPPHQPSAGASSTVGAGMIAAGSAALGPDGESNQTTPSIIRPGTGRKL